MSGRAPHHRSDAVLDATVNQTIARYVSMTGWTPSLPVPIEQILEVVYDLRILWDDIEERPGEMILGALIPSERQIVMNQRHLEGRLRTMGPINFTFAHELGHWLFDAVDPNQSELFAPDMTPVFCRGADNAERAAVTRERNCDRFAARLLLPTGLLDVHELAFLDGEQLRDAARAWGVSLQTLEIRTSELSGPAPGPRSGRLL
jgi:hypothetical protein